MTTAKRNIAWGFEMGKKRVTQGVARIVKASGFEQLSAARAVLDGGHPKLREMRLALRGEVELSKAAAKKTRNRAKNKAAKSARRKTRRA
jgi:hypothetical protein